MWACDEWYEESDCGAKCKSPRCVWELNAVITRADIHQFKDYVRGHCPSSTTRPDVFGRYPIQIAASCGKIEILDWLITTFRCDLNQKDRESGWTALHRAVYYGRLACAVLLIEYGANMWLRDKDGFTPMDIAMMDTAPWVESLQFIKSTYQMPCALDDDAGPSEVYTWGANDNYVLGHRNLRGSKLPDFIEFFTRTNVKIKQVVMAKFHSVFVTTSGSVFTCGLGEGGRLGCGHQETCIEPTEMSLGPGVSVISAAAAVNHTALVTENGQLFVCGLNKHHVLGVTSSTDRELTPVRVYGLLKHLRVIGCAVGALHTVAWTDNNAVYTFGTNAGQLGHAKGDLYIKQPRQVSAVYNEEDTIVCVGACDSATIVATKQGTVYLLQNYICRKIVVKQLDIEQVVLGGGRLDYTLLSQVDQRLYSSHAQLKDDNIRVLIRKKSGDLLSWSKSHGTLDRCKFSLPQSFMFKHVALCGHGHTALLVTNTGQAYQAKFGNWIAPKPPRRNSMYGSSKGYDSCLEMLDADPVQEFYLEQISGAFRCHFGALGPKAKGGALLQREPITFVTDVPEVSQETLLKDVRKLWEDGPENESSYDVIITATDKNGNRLVSLKCHRYILASKSSYLRNILCSNKNYDVTDVTPEIIFEKCDPNILKNVIQFIYCDSCQLLQNGFKPQPLAQGTNSSDVAIVWGTKSLNSIKDEHVENCIVTNGNASAFSVYKANGENGVISSKKSKKQSGGVKNALSEFKILAKKLGLRSSIFESTYIQNGQILVQEKTSSSNSIQFDRHKFTQFCDIKLRCCDGVTFDGHKCILVSRVEYFRSMLVSGWAESCLSESQVSIPSEVFKHVLDFVYTDSSLLLYDVSSLEILCEIMAAADQLLLTRLKEASEARVASMLTLKNVSSIIEFSTAFHCPQLRKTCQQFICQNLAALMHTPQFYSIEYKTLEKAEEYYRSNIDGVFMRIITPSSEAPDLPKIDVIPDDIAESPEFESTFTMDDTITSQEKFSAGYQNKKRFQNRRRSSKKSLSKSASFGIVISELLSSVNVSDTIVQQITSTTKNKISDSSTPDASPTKEKEFELSPSENSDPNSTVPIISPPSKSSVPNDPISTKSSFKDVMAEQAKQNNPNIITRNPENPWGQNLNSVIGLPTPATPVYHGTSGVPIVKHSNSSVPIVAKTKKLSQKQRKKLEQESTRQKVKNDEQDGTSTTSTVPVNAWAKPLNLPTTNVKSLRDVMKEQSAPVVKRPQPVIVRETSPEKQRPPSSENPWQLSPERKPKVTVRDQCQQSPSFRDIMHNEKSETEWEMKQKNKPMHLIQMEDKAMAELKDYYEKNTPLIEGQFFTVERIKHLSSYRK